MKQEPEQQDMHPLMLLCHSHYDLDLYTIHPKIDREHLLSMTKCLYEVLKGWA